MPSSKKSWNSTDQTNLYYLAVFWRLAGYCLFSATKFQWRHCQVLAVDAFYTSGLINKRFFIALSYWCPSPFLWDNVAFTISVVSHCIISSMVLGMHWHWCKKRPQNSPKLSDKKGTWVNSRAPFLRHWWQGCINIHKPQPKVLKKLAFHLKACDIFVVCTIKCLLAVSLHQLSMVKYNPPGENATCGNR